MFDACICVNVDDGDRCDFVNQTYPKAKKRHRCTECFSWIEQGETYERVAGKWGDHFSTFKTCSICQQIRDDLFECGYFFGEIWERIHEMYCGSVWTEDEDACVCPDWDAIREEMRNDA